MQRCCWVEGVPSPQITRSVSYCTPSNRVNIIKAVYPRIPIIVINYQTVSDWSTLSIVWFLTNIGKVLQPSSDGLQSVRTRTIGIGYWNAIKWVCPLMTRPLAYLKGSWRRSPKPRESGAGKGGAARTQILLCVPVLNERLVHPLQTTAGESQSC